MQGKAHFCGPEGAHPPNQAARQLTQGTQPLVRAVYRISGTSGRREGLGSPDEWASRASAVVSCSCKGSRRFEKAYEAREAAETAAESPGEAGAMLACGFLGVESLAACYKSTGIVYELKRGFLARLFPDRPRAALQSREDKADRVPLICRTLGMLGSEGNKQSAALANPWEGTRQVAGVGDRPAAHPPTTSVPEAKSSFCVLAHPSGLLAVCADCEHRVKRCMEGRRWAGRAWCWHRFVPPLPGCMTYVIVQCAACEGVSDCRTSLPLGLSS